jgi:ATP/ADP translocase
VSDEKTTGLHAFVALPLLCGSCTTGNWRTGVSETGEAAISLPSVLAPVAPWSGSLVMGLVGIVGVWYLASRMIRRRGWLVVGLCLCIDWLLTTLFVWQVRDAALTNPLGLWPYVLGALATFIAGMVAGYLVSPAPLRLASASFRSIFS